MKLKSNLVIHYINDTQYLVPVGDDAPEIIARNNKTAGFIVDCLKEETTEEAIVDSMLRKFDAPRETVVHNVKEILDKLRKVNMLEE